MGQVHFIGSLYRFTFRFTLEEGRDMTKQVGVEIKTLQHPSCLLMGSYLTDFPVFIDIGSQTTDVFLEVLVFFV